MREGGKGQWGWGGRRGESGGEVVRREWGWSGEEGVG